MSLCPILAYEVSTAGVDEALQGLTSDPWVSPTASNVGLRIPSLVNSSSTRYVFQLATRQLNGRTRLRGMRTLVTIGTNATPGGDDPDTEVPIEVPVTTPGFHFSDGNVSFHLVVEPNTRTLIQRGSADSASSALQEADGPAFIYGPGTTWTAGFFDPLSGAPLYYNQGLASYAPPQDVPARWASIGSLGCFYDCSRFPWDAANAWNSLDIPLEENHNARISLYATVLQTDGGGAIPSVSSGAVAGLPPEQRFLQGGGTDARWGNGVYYWRVAGSLIFEDEDSSCVPGVPVTPFGPRGPVPPSPRQSAPVRPPLKVCR